MMSKSIASTWLTSIKSSRASKILALVSLANFAFLCYLVATGFPAKFFSWSIRLKNIRTPFIALVVLISLSILLHPDRSELTRKGYQKFKSWTDKKSSIWILAGVYSLLFVWQQVAEYLAVEINFIPFGFYDYMLYYLFHGAVNFTGLLHGYYHLNNILILLSPLWILFQSPWVLVITHGLIAAAAAIPLFLIARQRLENSASAFVIAFIYLNYNYLQNILEINFAVEIFYPVLLFSALYSAISKQWSLYYLFVFLGLLVKEDSVVYFSTLGMLVFFTSSRKHGLATLLASVLYTAFLLKIVIPMTGNTILAGDLRNFPKHGSSAENPFWYLVKHPLIIPAYLFGSLAKLQTYLKILYKLCFLPLFSPSAFLILFPIFLLFFRNTGRDVDFTYLHFQYAAAVIPFVFIAFVFGFSNLQKKIPVCWRAPVSLAVLWLLVVLNGGHYRTKQIDEQKLKSIRWAKSIPKNSNLVTHGSLLPYVGYRRYNYYFAKPWSLPAHPYHKPYSNADYYYIDLNVNPYPMDQDFAREQVHQLKSNCRYALIRFEENSRYLFKKIGS